LNHETRLWERPRGEGGNHEEHEEDWKQGLPTDYADSHRFLIC
jgi:hypothetical protein